jgi:hypothetical protein
VLSIDVLQYEQLQHPVLVLIAFSPRCNIDWPSPTPTG